MADQKPTRRDLLIILTHLQGLVGDASALYQDDRNPHGPERAREMLSEAQRLCIAALAFDPPVCGEGRQSRRANALITHAKGPRLVIPLTTAERMASVSNKKK